MTLPLGRVMPTTRKSHETSTYEILNVFKQNSYFVSMQSIQPLLYDCCMYILHRTRKLYICQRNTFLYATLASTLHI